MLAEFSIETIKDMDGVYKDCKVSNNSVCYSKAENLLRVPNTSVTSETNFSHIHRNHLSVKRHFLTVDCFMSPQDLLYIVRFLPQNFNQYGVEGSVKQIIAPFVLKLVFHNDY